MIEKYNEGVKVKEPVELYCAVLTEDRSSIKLMRQIDAEQGFPDNGDFKFEGMTRQEGMEILSEFGPEDETTRDSTRKFLLLQKEEVNCQELLHSVD